MKKYSVIFLLMLIITFISCEMVSNDKSKTLDNKADQQKVDQITNGITLSNSNQNIDDLASLYANRINIVGYKDSFAKDKVFEVWPTGVARPTEEKQTLVSPQVTSSGKHKADPFSKLLNNPKFKLSKIEVRYIKDIRKILKSKNKEVTYYTTKIGDLQGKYEKHENLTLQVKLFISTISRSIKIYLPAISKKQIKDIGFLNYVQPNEASFLLFQTTVGGAQGAASGGVDAREAQNNYTTVTGFFAPNWGEVAESAVLGSAIGLSLISIHVAWASAAMAPEEVLAEYISTGVIGVGGSSITELAMQWTQHQQYVNEHPELW